MNLSFQARVYNAVKKIPRGKVLIYKEVAVLAGNPKAFRAVGNTFNKNYNPQIPCHRVVKSNGDTGGYNKGKTNKKILLISEKAI